MFFGFRQARTDIRQLAKRLSSPTLAPTATVDAQYRRNHPARRAAAVELKLLKLCNWINTERNGERRAIARQLKMAILCKHLSAIPDFIPSAFGVRRICLKSGDPGCIHGFSAPGTMSVAATSRQIGTQQKHFHATRHPIIEAFDPPEGWGWCYVDEVTFDLSGRQTSHLAPIPRSY